jgi:hypothetical protein
LFSVWGRGRQVVETSTVHVSDQGIEDRGHRSRWSDACCSETPTDQYIIHNIKRDVWELVLSCENDSVVRTQEFLLPLPRSPSDDTQDRTWTTHAVVEEPLSDDEDGVPHDVSDSESESKNDSNSIYASCDTEGIRVFCFYIWSSTLFYLYLHLFFFI